ncbi:hypothetical protein AK812_SmicGene7004 [Symbiodinium microadriaticum]|uniref:Uncharacterized protein n=1 Tax=Symbiodinium microadriaticum TaxID=2951 RepID=A0A1Q9EPP7_SYMMI|nr:hypothetical protein AK812_SmicGene7004 [Symbiodinium microadriaticum]
MASAGPAADGLNSSQILAGERRHKSADKRVSPGLFIAVTVMVSAFALAELNMGCPGKGLPAARLDLKFVHCEVPSHEQAMKLQVFVMVPRKSLKRRCCELHRSYQFLYDICVIMVFIVL